MNPTKKDSKYWFNCNNPDSNITESEVKENNANKFNRIDRI